MDIFNVQSFSLKPNPPAPESIPPCPASLINDFVIYHLPLSCGHFVLLTHFIGRNKGLERTLIWLVQKGIVCNYLNTVLYFFLITQKLGKSNQSFTSTQSLPVIYYFISFLLNRIFPLLNGKNTLIK